MDTNSWRPAPGGGGEPTMDAGDWRSQLQPDSRQRIVNKIMDTVKRHFPFSGQELKKIAVKFEEKIYTSATCKSDYLRKISMKMLTIETKSQNTNSPLSNSGTNSKNPPDTDKGICGSLMVKRQKLLQQYSNLIDDALLSTSGTEFMEDNVEFCKRSLAITKTTGEDEDGRRSYEMSCRPPSQHSFKELHRVRAKGCGKRLKGGKEKTVKKRRRCNGCGLMGLSHDKRNCPKLLNASSKDVPSDDDTEDDNEYDVDSQNDMSH